MKINSTLIYLLWLLVSLASIVAVFSPGRLWTGAEVDSSLLKTQCEILLEYQEDAEFITELTLLDC